MVYFVVDESEDLESHFDLKFVFATEQELNKAWPKVKKEMGSSPDWNVYCCQATASDQEFVKVDKKELDISQKEKEEWETYCRLKQKFESPMQSPFEKK